MRAVAWHGDAMEDSMERSRRVLALTSTAQLVCGVIGLVLAIRRRHPFDVPMMKGSTHTVGRDSLLMGTAMSAPAPMLAAQAAMTAALWRRRDPRAAAWLRTLGLLMTGGYLAERLVRHRLRPSGWDAIETPLLACGIGLSLGMVVAGRPRSQR